MKNLTIRQHVIYAIVAWGLGVACYYIQGMLLLGVAFIYISSFMLTHLLIQQYLQGSKKKWSHPVILTITAVGAIPLAWVLTIVTLLTLLFIGSHSPGGIGE